MWDVWEYHREYNMRQLEAKAIKKNEDRVAAGNSVRGIGSDWPSFQVKWPFLS